MKSFAQLGAKIHLWNMTHYDRILYLDNDILMVQDVTNLFVEANKRDNFAEKCSHPILGVPHSENGQCLNTGLLVIKPSHTHHAQMLFELVSFFFFFGGGGIKACGAVDERAHTVGLTGSGMEAKEVSLP